MISFNNFINEGKVKQFEMDLNDMIKDIKSGYGWIDPEFVEDTWENTSDSIDFELVKGEIYKRLIDAKLLAYADDENEESAGQYIKSLKELGIKESAMNESVEYVGYVEYEKGKKLIDTFKDMKAAKTWNDKNVDDLLDDESVESVGYMPKSEWDKKEAKYAITESKVTLKRKYTENHPAVTVGKNAAVRNRMLEAIKDGKLTREEFNNILKEFSKDSSKWLRRNSKFFNVSEDGITLSKIGSKTLKAITINEVSVEEGNAFIYAAAKAKRDGKKEFEFNGKTYKVTLKADVNLKENKNMKTNFIYESFSEFVNSINEASIVLDATDPKSKDLLKLLKKNNVKMENLGEGPNGWDEVELTGDKKDLIKVISDEDAGWGDSDLEEYIEESNGTYSIKVRSLNESVVIIESKEAQEAESILNDLLDERGGDMDELQGMSMEDALDTVETYGHSGSKAKKIAQELVSMCNESIVNEAFSSAKLASLLTGAHAMPKDLPQSFYNMSKLALDQIQDVDIIEMTPADAKKEKRASAVYLYFTTNEKPNPYAGESAWRDSKTIPANTLLAITDGSNEWMNAEWNKYRSANAEGKVLKTTKRDDSAGFHKSGSRDKYGTGISSMKQVAELADRAYCLDLTILKARYSTETQRAERAAAKKGAIAFQNDKDFKQENLNRYNTIIANRAAEMPIDKMVADAIDTLSLQIKDALAKGEKTRYNEILLGTSSKGREAKVQDAASHMQRILDDFQRYVGYTNQAEEEKKSGMSDSDLQVEKESKALNDALEILNRITN